MDSVEDYARRLAKEEEVGMDKLFEWVKSIASLVNKLISILSSTMSTRCKPVFEILMSLLTLLISMVIMSLFQQIKHLIILCLFARHTTFTA